MTGMKHIACISGDRSSLSFEVSPVHANSVNYYMHVSGNLGCVACTPEHAAEFSVGVLEDVAELLDTDLREELLSIRLKLTALKNNT